MAIEPNNPAAVRIGELGWTDVSDDFEAMKSRAAYRKFNFPYLYDGETQSVAQAYGPKATPHVFIFDEKRILRFEGRIDDNQREPLVKTHETRNALDAMLAGRPVEVAHTGVFGCSTKWMSKAAGRADGMKKIESEPVRLEDANAEELKKLARKPRRETFAGELLGHVVRAMRHGIRSLQTTFRMYRRRDFSLVTVAANQPDERPGVMKELEKQHASSRNLIFASTDTSAMQAAFDPRSGIPACRSPC